MKVRLAFAFSVFSMIWGGHVAAQSFHERNLLDLSDLSLNLFGEGNRTHFSRWTLVYHDLSAEGQVTASLTLDEDPIDWESCLRSVGNNAARAIDACWIDCFDCEFTLLETNGAIGFRTVHTTPRGFEGDVFLLRDGSMMKIMVNSPHRDILDLGLDRLMTFANAHILSQDL